MNGKMSEKLTDYTATDIQKLFGRCVQSQELVEQSNPQKPARDWLFEDCKIMPVPLEAQDDFIAERYRQLVEVLKTPDDLQAWHWLGHWLKSENLRDPVKFFPEVVLKRMVQEAEISPAAIRNARVVRIWLPYCEPLVRRMKWRRHAKVKNQRTQWETQAYNAGVRTLVTTKDWNSAEEFTCNWIAQWSQAREKKYQRETLVNSYSKCVSKWWVRFSKCSFCRRHATGEFWFREEPIPHCGKHQVDGLPKGRSDSWRDDSGRSWWREDLDVCTTLPGAPR